jgi:endonuclease YncB( thermonuclease family)
MPTRAAQVETAGRQILEARVVGVSDGDTIRVLHDRMEMRVRLWGIDAPESRQPYGTRAKQHLSGLIYGTDVRLEVLDRDRYGRIVARVFADGADVGLLMVEAGLAWHYERYAPDDVELAEAQVRARRQGRGLWHEPSAVPPWRWRATGRPAVGAP